MKMSDIAKQYRMVIDVERCIGCHACEVACKQEFEAPLGFFRTMTLYMDTGNYPKVKREFYRLCAVNVKMPHVSMHVPQKLSWIATES